MSKLKASLRVEEGNKLPNGLFEIWRDIPSDLNYAEIGFHGPQSNFDYEEWENFQICILNNFSSRFNKCSTVVFGVEFINTMDDLFAEDPNEKASLDILWSGRWVPIPRKRKSYLLNNEGDFTKLIKSIVWDEHKGTFIFFTNETSKNLADRIIKKQWGNEEQFVVATPINTTIMAVFTNCFNAEKLKESLIQEDTKKGLSN